MNRIYIFILLSLLSVSTIVAAPINNDKLKEAVEIMIAYLHISETTGEGNTNYIRLLPLEYDQNGYISAQPFSNNPLTLKTDKFFVKWNDNGYIWIEYKDQQFGFARKDGLIHTLTIESPHTTLSSRYDIGYKDNKFFQIKEDKSKYRDARYNMVYEFAFDNENRINRMYIKEEFVRDRQCTPWLKAERLIAYQADGNVTITKLAYPRVECRQDIPTGGTQNIYRLFKESENGYTQVYSSGTKATERYDEQGNTIFRNYINPDSSGWQEQFEFVDGKQVKTDKSNIKNGKLVNRIVTTNKEKGKKLIQYYDDSDEIYKEEFNQKTRTKKDGVWSDWEY